MGKKKQRTEYLGAPLDRIHQQGQHQSDPHLKNNGTQHEKQRILDRGHHVGIGGIQPRKYFQVILRADKLVSKRSQLRDIEKKSRLCFGKRGNIKDQQKQQRGKKKQKGLGHLRL